MAYFAWTDDLKVGNSFIDHDHQKLIGLVNELHDAMAHGKGKEMIGKVLNELIKYTQEHFKREEDHMQRAHYADLAAHKQEHDKLIREVLELRDKFNAGNAMLSVQVSSFLRGWLLNHIMGADKKLAAALRQAAHH